MAGIAAQEMPAPARPKTEICCVNHEDNVKTIPVTSGLFTFTHGRVSLSIDLSPTGLDVIVQKHANPGRPVLPVICRFNR